MTKHRTPLTRLKSFVERKDLFPAALEVLDRRKLVNEKLAKKNRRLRNLQNQLQRKDRKIGLLQTQLAKAEKTGVASNPSLQESPFFVVGRAKSGTSWLRSILDAHPEILCMNEGRLFSRNYRGRDTAAPRSLYGSLADSEDFNMWIERSPWSWDENVERHVRNATRQVVDYFMAEKLAHVGKKLAGDKTPLLSRKDVADIADIYPEARVVHIVRDGRDVAISSAHHIWNSVERGRTDIKPEILMKRDAYRASAEDFLGRGESIFAEKQLANIARNWADMTADAIEYGSSLLGDNYTEVRYEDLLERPLEETIRLLDFLGADASRQTAERCVETTSFERVSQRKRGHEDSTSFFRKGISGEWRSVFTEEDKRVFKRIAGDLLIELGYERDKDW